MKSYYCVLFFVTIGPKRQAKSPESHTRGGLGGLDISKGVCLLSVFPGERANLTADFTLHPLAFVPVRGSERVGSAEGAVFPVLGGPGKHGDDEGRRGGG